MSDKITQALNDLEWSYFKSIVNERKLKIQEIPVDGFHYLVAYDGYFKIGCRMLKEDPVISGSEYDDYLNNYHSSVNQSIEESGTLKIARSSAVTDVNGIATILIKVPGDPMNPKDGRIVDGGSAWFESGDYGDYAELFVTDEDNLLGGGSGKIIESWVDMDLNVINRGWFMEPPNAAIYITKMSSSFAWVPAGFYLKIVATKKQGALLPDNFYINISWGTK